MYELTETDGNVIEVFETREAVVAYVTAHWGVPTFGTARPHFPAGTVEPVSVLEADCHMLLVQVTS
jgi:hypothetical protein